MNKAVFWDRDGTLIDERQVLYPDALGALTQTRQAGYLNILVTNQPDVARGLLLKEDVQAFHGLLMQTLPLDAAYVCYHDDRHRCACRKPKPGLLLAAKLDHAIDFARSYLVGNEARDMQAGKAVGCLTILVVDGSGRTPAPVCVRDMTVTTLFQAADRIVYR